MLKVIGCYTKRQVSSTVGSLRLWILRNFDEHLSSSGMDLAAYRDEALKDFHLQKALTVVPAKQDEGDEPSFL